jgi:hypothetical protein
MLPPTQPGQGWGVRVLQSVIPKEAHDLALLWKQVARSGARSAAIETDLLIDYITVRGLMLDRSPSLDWACSGTKHRVKMGAQRSPRAPRNAEDDPLEMRELATS